MRPTEYLSCVLEKACAYVQKNLLWRRLVAIWRLDDEHATSYSTTSFFWSGGPRAMSGEDKLGPN